MKEYKFKILLLYIFYSLKVITIILVFILLDLGAILRKEVLGILSFMLPLFMAYIPAMLKNIFLKPYVDDEISTKKIRGSLVFITIIFMLFYALMIVYGLYSRASLVFDYEEMRTYFGFVEALAGGYVSVIVFSFFKK